jgi:hypothetical protein
VKKKPFSGLAGGRRVFVRGRFMVPKVANERLPWLVSEVDFTSVFR